MLGEVGRTLPGTWGPGLRMPVSPLTLWVGALVSDPRVPSRGSALSAAWGWLSACGCPVPSSGDALPPAPR